MSRHAVADDVRPAPTRVPFPQLRQPPPFLLWTVALVCLTWGGSYALGGPATAAHLLMMGAIAPIPLWGGVLSLAGLAALVRRTRLLGLFVATCVVLAWSLFQGISLVTGAATGVGVPLTLGLAALLARCLYLDRTEARDAVATSRGASRPARRRRV